MQIAQEGATTIPARSIGVCEQALPEDNPYADFKIIRRNGAEQYQYILRDESMHCNFGIDLVNQIKICAISRIAVASKSVWNLLAPGASNRFPWMSEMTDLKKERSFLETSVIEYQTDGALSWD